MDSIRPPDAQQIVDAMMKTDAFSKWLGIVIEEIRPGYARLKMEIKSEMLNGFGIAHGGISYSLADSALAFAANGHGRIALSTRTSISHRAKVQLGDILTAKTSEIRRDDKNAHYEVAVTNQNDLLVASFKGTVYLSSKNWNL